MKININNYNYTLNLLLNEELFKKKKKIHIYIE